MDTEELESRYMELFWRKQRRQWENYVDHARHDLSAIDEQILALLSPYQNAFEGQTRRERVLNATVKRACVDNHPHVARLRNRLDDRDNYTRDVEPLDKRDRIRFLPLLGERMREDVLELMRRRQELAKQQGHHSYPELVLWSEDLELEPVRALLSGQIRQHLPAAAALAKRYGIQWPSWNEDLTSIGQRSSSADCTDLVSLILQRLGFERLNRSISIVVTDQPFAAGYAGILSVPDDIRILVGPVTDLCQELTLYHELGHAIAHALNREKGIFRTWTSAYDEAMAIVIERIAALILLDDAQKQAAQDLWILEETRCSTSALFELELWGRPQAAEDLYLQYYGAWDIGVVPEHVWPADSFRSIDPVYIQNYVIGDRVAERTIGFLHHKFGDRFVEWGRWLAENYFADGRRRSLAEKTAVVGGLA